LVRRGQLDFSISDEPDDLIILLIEVMDVFQGQLGLPNSTNTMDTK
jgi:hypothetical protein